MTDLRAHAPHPARLAAWLASWPRTYLVTACAAALAWLAAQGLSAGVPWLQATPMVAAITAVLTVRASLHRAGGEAVTQVVGTLAGAGLSLLLLAAGWPEVLTAGAAVFGTLLLARVLRLGEQASVLLPVTALIVVGPGLHEAAAVDRFTATVVGAVIAVACSYLTQPGTPADRAQDAVAALGDDTARLLERIAEAAAGQFTLEAAIGWLEDARELNSRVDEVREECQDAVGFARWYPRASQARAAAVYARFLAVEHTVVSVRAVARSLVEVAERDVRLPEASRTLLGGALEAAATAAGAHAAATSTELDRTVDAADTQELAAVRDGGVLTGPVTGPVADSVTLLEEASARLAGQASTPSAAGAAPEAAVMTAAMAVSLQRIADSLAMGSEALRGSSVSSVDAPGVAAVTALASGATAPVRLAGRARQAARRTAGGRRRRARRRTAGHRSDAGRQ